MIKEIERYKTKCMKNLTKQMAGILIFSLKNVINQLCKKDSKRLTNLIASTPCINAANSQINKCYSNLIDKILGAQNASETRRIPHVCCEYYKFFPCVATRTKRISACTEFHISTASDFVRSLSGDKQ
jgi:hypothetical protein